MEVVVGLVGVLVGAAISETSVFLRERARGAQAYRRELANAVVSLTGALTELATTRKREDAIRALREAQVGLVLAYAAGPPKHLTAALDVIEPKIGTLQAAIAAGFVRYPVQVGDDPRTGDARTAQAALPEASRTLTEALLEWARSER